MADDQLTVYQAIVAAQQAGRPCALATVTETQGSMPRHAGSKMLVYGNGTIVGTIGGGAMEAQVIKRAQDIIRSGDATTETYRLNNLADGDPGICGGTARIFIEPVAIAPSLIVIGGGHVGQAVAELGKWMGMRVILSDDRAEYANEDVVRGLDGYVVCAPSDIVDHVAINHMTYVAAVTRGLPVDLKLIPALLKTDAAYIGLIGSRRRWEITARELMKSGAVQANELARVHAPIGLELEAETPKEIALSILAEIVMVRRGGTGQPMKSSHEITPSRQETS